jgi:hypothetical protein
MTPFEGMGNEILVDTDHQESWAMPIAPTTVHWELVSIYVSLLSCILLYLYCSCDFILALLLAVGRNAKTNVRSHHKLAVTCVRVCIVYR